METVTVELTWEEYKLLVNCLSYTASNLNAGNSNPELLTKIEDLSNKVYISRTIVKDKSGI